MNTCRGTTVSVWGSLPFMLAALILGCSLFQACTRSRKETDGNPTDKREADQTAAPKYAGELTQEEYQRAKDEALASAQKAYEALMGNPQTKQTRLPNFETGPGRPLPLEVNFYTMDDHYPAYLECMYDVNEADYNRSNEPKWIGAALEQMRNLGPKKFPPFTWIAVCVRNRAEHRDARTFQQSFKVGAVFKAADVFGGSPPASQLVADAELDQHPFMFDRTQPTPGEQQRWVIVERHAAANHTASRTQ